MKIYFDHEKLDVYQEAIAFCGWVGDLLAQISAKAAAKDQLDRASTSIPLNIAEGNGKFSARDRGRFLEMARGSALECAACLDVLLVRKLTTEERSSPQKNDWQESYRCLLGYFGDFLNGRIFYEKKKRDMQSITITTRSRSRRNAKTFAT
jgi:four helix bundle protein